MIEWVYLLLAVSFMGFNSFIVKKLVKTLKPNVVMFYQFMLAMPLVLFYTFISGSEFIFNPLLLLIGLAYFVSLTLFYVALSKGNLIRAGPIWTLNLLVTALLGFVFLLEPVDLKIILGILFGVLSVYFLRGDN